MEKPPVEIEIKQKHERVPLFIVFSEGDCFKTEFGEDVLNNMNLEYALYTFISVFLEDWKENIKKDFSPRKEDDESIF